MGSEGLENILERTAEEEAILLDEMSGICDELEKDLPQLSGRDTNGETYRTPRDMWIQELSLTSGVTAEESDSKTASTAPKAAATNQNRAHRTIGAQEWINRGAAYWQAEENCPPTVDGVLGGYGFVSETDVEGSRWFLETLREHFPAFGRGRVADCGAGIGRITKNLLLKLFDNVDMVEQSSRLINTAKEYIEDQAFERVTLYCSALQDFDPEPDHYDCIWIQWVIGHLNDVDFIAFLHRCKKALHKGGLICIKENTVSPEAFVLDNEDSSITRSVEYFHSLFRQAGLKLVAEEEQDDLPDELFPVVMFALC